MTGSMSLTWLLIIPLLSSAIALAARWLGRISRIVIEGTHLISVTLVLVLSLWTVGVGLFTGPIFSLADWLHVDALGGIFLLIIGVVGFLVGGYSIGYTRHDLRTGAFDERKLSTYYALFNLFLFTMLLVVTANNIIMMWAAVEATTLGSAFLVGIYGHRPSLEASWKYVMVCTVGVAFGLYGTLLTYSDAFNLMRHPADAALWTAIIKHAADLDPALMKMAFVFVLVGFGTKAGLFPMHAWLPDAHSEAPSPISAMLSAVLLNCALLVILRFATISNLALGSSLVRTLFLVFGTASVAAAAFFIYVQRDLKRLLAYSSMENIGLIVVAFGIGGPAGYFAGLLQTINHSLVKALLFCTSGNILIKYRSRSLDQVGGMLQAIPGTGVLLLAGGLALIGVPPFNIFLSKFLIISVGLGSGYTWLMIACLILLVVVFTAFMRVIAAALFGDKPRGMTEGEANWLTLAPGAILIVLMLVLGVYIPPQLMAVLHSASRAVSNGDMLQQIPLIHMRDVLSPLAFLVR